MNMAGCVNASDGKRYEHFDVEGAAVDQTAMPATRAPLNTGRHRRCSLPLIMSFVTLVVGLLALAIAIYAAAVTRLVKSSDNQGSDILLTSNPHAVPNGYQLTGNLFQGTGYFARLAPMLYPRSDHKTLPVGNNVYLIGGLTDAKELQGTASATSAPVPYVLNRTVGYNIYTERSIQLQDMPQPRFRHCGTVLNDQLYVIGGMKAYERPTDPKHVVVDSVMRYTPATNTWEILKGRLQHARADCCAATVGGKIYVAGGWNANYADTLGSVEVYDPVTDTFSLMPNNLTTPRGDCEAAAVEDRYFLVLGGVAADLSFTSAVEMLEPQTANPTFNKRANMTYPRGDFAAEALPGNRVIVMGGEISNGTANEFAMYQVEEYYFNDDTWVVKAPLPEARFRFDTAHVGDKVYVFGGHPTCAGGQQGDGLKESCLKVALNTTWGYFDVQYPRIYALSRS